MTNKDTFEQRRCTFGFGAFDHPGPTMTSTCQTYTFDPHLNDKKTLCFIDTPSLEDTPQCEQENADAIKHILDYVNQLSHLNVVCFLIDSKASRLNTLFRTCFTELLNLLGSHIRQNIIFGFTHARSRLYQPAQMAPLLRAMLKSVPVDNIPFNGENTFLFDNESFRYLVVLQNRIQWYEEEKHEYERSWQISVSESKRLLDHIQRRPVYRILRE